MKLTSVLILLLVLILPFLALTYSFFDISFDKSYYHSQFDKLGTYDRVPDADEKLNNIHDFLGGNTDLEGFSDKEVSHMFDVRTTIMGFYISFIVLSIIASLIILYLKDIKLISHILIASFALIFILSLIANFVDFSSLFTAFHNIFFESGTWTFSKDDLLIQLFPFEFFHNISKAIVIQAMYQLFIITSFSIFIRNIYKKA